MSSDPKVCNACGHSNPAKAKMCERCGSMLDREAGDIVTAELAKYAPPPTGAEYAPDVSKVPNDTLALFALGKPDPLVARVLPRITLGRTTPGAEPPTIDLTDFGAKDLGVSRRHAMILYMDGEYKLVDLDSTNGTWLNEQQLIPNKPYTLRSTDQVRLGRLQLFIYFRRETQVAPKLEQEDTLLFAPRTTSISVHFVAETVVPYLEGLQEIQSIIDELRGRGPTQVHVLALETVGASLKIRVRGAHEAVSALRRLIPPPESKEGAAVSGEPEAAAADKPDGRILKGAAKGKAAKRAAVVEATDDTVEETTAHMTMPPPLQQALEIIETFVPNPSAASQITYTSRLLPALEALTRSDLVLTEPSAKAPAR